jgi:hypothetical protein
MNWKQASVNMLLILSLLSFLLIFTGHEAIVLVAAQGIGEAARTILGIGFLVALFWIFFH